MKEGDKKEEREEEEERRKCSINEEVNCRLLISFFYKSPFIF
jgi:hypothetical protein